MYIRQYIFLLRVNQHFFHIMNTVKHPKTPEDLDEILQNAGRKLVAIDFGATWCPPCRRIKPFFESLPSKYPDVIFVSVDVDELQMHPLLAGVSSVPTFKFFVSMNLLSTFSGALESQITSTIERLKPLP